MKLISGPLGRQALDYRSYNSDMTAHETIDFAVSVLRTLEPRGEVVKEAMRLLKMDDSEWLNETTCTISLRDPGPRKVLGLAYRISRRGFGLPVTTAQSDAPPARG